MHRCITLAGLMTLILILSMASHGNMASPDWAGTRAGEGQFSQDIDVLSEVIDIHIFEPLSYAEYNIRYEVYSDKARRQVPLVFDINDIKGTFLVSVNGQPIPSLPVAQVQGLDHAYHSANGEAPSATHAMDADTITLTISDNTTGNGNQSSSQILTFDDSDPYFLVDLNKGKNTISVRYQAVADENRLDWTKRYTYDYALAPAKLWKSFDDLTINVQIEGDLDTLDFTTNLGTPRPAPLDTPPDAPQSAKQSQTNLSHYQWYFTGIPQDTLTLSLQKHPTGIAKWLIAINSWAMLCIILPLLALLHVRLIKRSCHQRQQTHGTSAKPSRWLVWLGILLVPFISLLLVVLRFDVIDWLLGIHASRYHAYVVFILVFGYVPLLLLYGVFVMVWLKFSRRQTS